MEVSLTTLQPLSLAPRVGEDVDAELLEQYPELADAIKHAHGTDDPVFAPAIAPQQLGLAAEQPLAAAPSMWLPEGFHWGLHIVHRPLLNAGPMTQRDKHRGIIHTTESDWWAVDAMHHVLDVKRAASTLLIGGRRGLKNPVVYQHMPLNVAARALEHPAGAETNRAACVQLEWCWRAANGGDAPDWMLKALANLFTLVDHRYNIAARAPRAFAGAGKAHRMSAAEWRACYGYFGHEHVYGNIHWDPGAFKSSRFIHLLTHVPSGGYNLAH